MLIQVVALTGQSVYIIIFNASGQVWNTSNLAFETYNVSNWSHYYISCTEAAGSGNYFVSVPSQIATAGNYTWTGYVRLGASPASGDTPVSQGNFTISSTISTGMSALIQRLRILAQDTVNSHTIYSESLGTDSVYPINGSNTIFRLKSIPVAAATPFVTPAWSVYLTSNLNGTLTIRDQTAITLSDPTNGIIILSSAPASGTLITADYNYLWYADASYTEWLNEAAQQTLAGATDPTVIVEGLVEPMLQFALAHFARARSSFFGEQIRASGGDQSQDAQTKADFYDKMANNCDKKAQNLLDRYYQRQGQRNAPAYADINHNWDPISPKR